MTADILSLPPAALHDQLTHRLRQMLVENQIPPGAKLNERTLCETLHVSRTPLREAIKALAAEGLVALVPNRGAIALALTEEDVQHTFEVLGGLEAHAGGLAAARITEAELREIQALHFEMLAAYTRRDLSHYYRLNAHIHQRINWAAKNPVLSATYSQVNARLQALRFRSNQDELKWGIAMEEHTQMVNALAARDGEALSRILQQHLQHKCEVVIAQLRGTNAFASNT